VQILRRARSAVIVLSLPPADPNPQALAFEVNAATSAGEVLSLTLRTRDVRRIGGRPAIVLTGVSRKAALRVAVRAVYRGDASRFASGASAARS